MSRGMAAGDEGRETEAELRRPTSIRGSDAPPSPPFSVVATPTHALINGILSVGAPLTSMAPVFALYRPFAFADPTSTGGNTIADWPLDGLTVVWEWLLRVGRAVGQWLGHAAGIVFEWLKGVAQATGVWMEEHWPLVAEFLRQASEPVNDRPLPFVLVSAAIFLGPQILLIPLIALHLLFLFLLALIGFGTRGIVAGSPAAGYQSLYYGGSTPTGSLFSIFQSMGMKYNAVTLGNWVFAVIRLVAGIVFVYSLCVLLSQ